MSQTPVLDTPMVEKPSKAAVPVGRPSSLIDTRIIYCGDCLDQLRKLPDGCVDLIYIDPPFNSNRNYEVFWGETKEKRAFEDRHASTQAYIEYMRPRCVELARVLKKTGSYGYHRGSWAKHWEHDSGYQSYKPLVYGKCGRSYSNSHRRNIAA